LPHSAERDEALRNRQSNLLYLLTDDPIPEEIRDVFSDWEACFSVEKSIYEVFSREGDRLLKQWHDKQTTNFEDNLIVVVGVMARYSVLKGKLGTTRLSTHTGSMCLSRSILRLAGIDRSGQSLRPFQLPDSAGH
jgi:hypothetical protein